MVSGYNVMGGAGSRAALTLRLKKMRSKVTGAQRWVVKIGSALLTADGKGLDRAAMSVWVEQMVALHEAGVELVLVSSGAVAAGMSRLGWTARPSAMHELQAAAAIGQMGLVQAWESSFAEHGRHTAQILLTHDDLSDRKRYLNARSTLRALVELKVIPVINENDTVVTDEIRFGDNDTLAALVANLVEADLLVILTDRDGMFDADPRNNPDAQLIYEARADDPALDAVAGSVGGALGRGGMQTKLRAAVWPHAPAPTRSSLAGAWSACWIASRPVSASVRCCRRNAACWRRANSGWPVICKPVAPWCWMKARYRRCPKATRACCQSASSWSRAASAVAKWWCAWRRMVVRSPVAWPTTAPWKRRKLSDNRLMRLSDSWVTWRNRNWCTAIT